MRRERELLARALAVLENVRLADHFDFDLEDHIRAELQRPELEETNSVITIGKTDYMGFGLKPGKYRLLAERINEP
jgi:hypothetical protein